MAALAGHLADHRAVLRSAVWSRAAAPAVRSSAGALCAGRRSAESLAGVVSWPMRPFALRRIPCAGPGNAATVELLHQQPPRCW